MQAILIIVAIGIFALTIWQLKSGRIRFKKGDVPNTFHTLGFLALFLVIVIWACIKVLGIKHKQYKEELWLLFRCVNY